MRIIGLAHTIPKGKLLGFHMVDAKYPVHLDTLAMLRWTIGGGGGVLKIRVVLDSS